MMIPVLVIGFFGFLILATAIAFFIVLLETAPENRLRRKARIDPARFEEGLY